MQSDTAKAKLAYQRFTHALGRRQVGLPDMCHCVPNRLAAFKKLVIVERRKGPSGSAKNQSLGHSENEPGQLPLRRM
jgi:hypothetical protein